MQFQDTGPETDLTLFVLNSSANTVITIHKMKSKNHIEQHQEGKYHSVNHNKKNDLFAQDNKQHHIKI